MFGSFRSRLALLIGLASASVLMVTALPASADNAETIRCVGTADFCGATVSIAGGASNRPVTINLTDTDFSRVGVRVLPGFSKGAFSITHATFLLGGSEYRFTLNAVSSNPPRARIILLFAAGRSA